MTNSYQLILASGSPRRREILKSIGLNFQVIPSQINEDLLSNEAPADYVQRLAREKAADIAKGFSQGYVIGADTTVVLDDEILGKPVDEREARLMLRKLADRWHTVYTGVAVIDAAHQQTVADYCATRVKFVPLTDAEIIWYVGTGEPMDKAGAYAIQGYGTLLVEEIEGNYLNVVGLPVTLLRRLMAKVGANLVEMN